MSRRALLLLGSFLVACSATGPSRADGSFGDGGEAGDASIDGGGDGGEARDASVDGGDGGMRDGGDRGLCSTCEAASDVCDPGLECRHVGGGFGYCARFLPTCPGLTPDIAAVGVEYRRACRSGGIECSIRARLELADAGLDVTGQSLYSDGGLSSSTGRASSPESVLLWRPLAVGCFAPSFLFPSDSCLTHSDYVVLRFELSDGGAADVEYSGGSSTLPSRAFARAVVSMVQAAERALDGGP